MPWVESIMMDLDGLECVSVFTWTHEVVEKA